MPLTDAQIVNVIFNETRSLPGADVQRARVNIAHAIINADNSSHARRSGSGSGSGQVTFSQCECGTPTGSEKYPRHCRLFIQMARAYALYL
jgi:hypothetical protein